MYNEYEAAEVVEIGKAQNVILGEKPIFLTDTVSGDPDTLHRPVSMANYED